jgi:phage/plasmid-like protein (TIGR03299 family)
MAHEIQNNDYMVSGNNVTPWHGLGAIELGNLSAADALAKARLNWTVDQESVFDSDMIQIKGCQLNRRSDDKTVLGIVSDGWTPIQNHELLEIAEALGQVDGLEYKPVIETAGSLKGGKIVWALIQTGQKQFHGSEHKAYMLLSNGHVAGRGLRGTATDVRVVCNNTLTAAERSDSAIFITHTQNVKQRLDSAIKLLKWGNDALDATFAIYSALAAYPINTDKAHAFFCDLMPTENNKPNHMADQMVDLFKNGNGNEGKNLFDAVNAVTDWVDHGKNYRDNETTAERRFMNSNMSGGGDRMKRAALNKAHELVS